MQQAILNYKIMLILMFIILCLFECVDTAKIIARLKVQGDYVTISGRGNRIIVIRPDKTMALFLYSKQTFIQINYSGGDPNIWIPGTNFTNYVAFQYIRQFLPQFTMSQQSFYITTRNNGWVMRGDISFDIWNHFQVLLKEIDTHYCTSSYSCIYSEYRNYNIYYNPYSTGMTILLSNSTQLSGQLSMANINPIPSLTQILWIIYDPYSSNPINIYFMRDGVKQWLISISIYTLSNRYLCDAIYRQHVFKCVDNVLFIYTETVQVYDQNTGYLQVLDVLVYQRQGKTVFKRACHKIMAVIVSQYNYYVAVSLLTSNGEYHLQIYAMDDTNTTLDGLLDLHIKQAQYIKWFDVSQNSSRVTYLTAAGELIVIDQQVGVPEVIQTNQFCIKFPQSCSINYEKVILWVSFGMGVGIIIVVAVFCICACVQMRRKKKSKQQLDKQQEQRVLQKIQQRVMSTNNNGNFRETNIPDNSLANLA